MPRGTSLSAVSLAGHHPPAATPPGLLGGGARGPSGGGRPAAPRGAIYKVREIKDMALLKTLQLGERGPQGPSLTVMGGLRHLFQSFYGSLDSEGRMELRSGLCFAGVLRMHKQRMHRHASASLRKTAAGRGNEFAQTDLRRTRDGSDSMAGTLSCRRIRQAPL